jgi:lysophospholipid acyltransferase (LPLAT)-like uncharacterized protein
MRLKNFLKISNESGGKTFLFRVLQFLIYKLAATWRFSFKGPKIKEQAITVFWHDQIYPLSKYMEHTNSVALVSLSRDGEIVTNFVKGWGHEIIRGSSTRGNREVLELLIKMGKTRKVFLTPDGPRGPRHKLKLGALVAAQKAKVPFYLLKTDANGYRLKSWDRFLIPWPFAKINVTLSEPHYISPHYRRKELEDLALSYEEWLNS